MNRRFKLGSVLLSGAAVLALTSGVGAQPVAFTGDVEADFNSETVLVPQDVLGEVGLPGNAPGGTISGWDIKDVRFSYDRVNDELYVGINFDGVGGDPDGNGDPAVAAQYLTDNFGFDRPAWGGTESFVVSFDFDRDGNFDVVAGLDLFSDITGFQVATANIAGPTPPLTFDTPLPGNIGIAPADTSAGMPDIEFSIAGVSTLPGATFDPDEDPASLLFFASVFAGSLDDDGIGEDFLQNHLLVIGKVSWDKDSDGNLLAEDSDIEAGMNFADQGLLVSGISDTGNPGAFVNDYTDDPTTLDLNPNNGDFLADPYVLQTKPGAGLDDSDAGLLTISFVSPLSGDPVSAHYASVRVVDMEDAAGRGNGFVDFNLNGGGVCTEVLVVGGDGNIQDIDKGAPGGAIDIDSFDVKTGDIDDSAAIDLVCWTYWEPIVTSFRFDDINLPGIIGMDLDPGEKAETSLPNLAENLTSNPVRIGLMTARAGLNVKRLRRSVAPNRIFERIGPNATNANAILISLGGAAAEHDGQSVFVGLSQHSHNVVTGEFVICSTSVREFLLQSQ